MKKLQLFIAFAVGIVAFLAVGTLLGFDFGLGAGLIGAAHVAFTLPAGTTKSEYVRTMREMRATLMQQMQTLSDLPELSDEQKREFVDLQKRIDDLDVKIKEVEDSINYDIEFQKARNRFGGSTQRIDSNTDKDVKSFRFAKFFNDLRAGKLTGVEAEMAQEHKLETLRAGVQATSGIGIPTIVLGQRGVVAGSSGTGKYMVTDEPIQFIDALMQYLVLVGLGAQYYDGLVGNLPLTSDSDVAAAVWADENGDSTETTPTFSRATMSPKRLTAFVEMSNQLLIQGGLAVENKIRMQLAAAQANAIQLAAINGSGTAPTPRGILNTSGIGSVSIGTNGGAATWAKIVELETKVDASNALMGNLAYLTNSKVRGALKTISKDSGSGRFLLENNELNGYPLAVTNHVPSDLDKGTTSDACSAIIFGNWADLAIGQWAGIDITADPFGKLKKGATDIVLNSFNDVAVLRPKSFAACVDVTTA